MDEKSRNLVYCTKLRSSSISPNESVSLPVKKSIFSSLQINHEESFTTQNLNKNCFLEEENLSESSISVHSGVVTVDTSIGNTEYFVFKNVFASHLQDSCNKDCSSEMVELENCIQQAILTGNDEISSIDSISVISGGSISIENFQDSTLGQFFPIHLYFEQPCSKWEPLFFF
jgi:hypothetical protein